MAERPMAAKGTTMTHEQDDAKVAAKWLWGWEEGQQCPGCDARMTEHGFGDIVNGEPSRGKGHDIPSPDFADPAVYDRALRELDARKIVVKLENGYPWACELRTKDWITRAVGIRPTIGSAIAEAIAELARAEGVNDADMGASEPQAGRTGMTQGRAESLRVPPYRERRGSNAS